MNNARSLSIKTIAGIEFIADRCVSRGIVFWVPMVRKTGRFIQAGVFKSHSRPAMWADMERTAKIIGPERWNRDTL